MSANDKFGSLPHALPDIATRIAAVALCRELFGAEHARDLWIALGLPPPKRGGLAPDAPNVHLVRAFIDDCCERDAGAEVRSSDLAGAFQGWAEAKGMRQLTPASIGRSLSALGFKRRQSNTIIWTGLKLRRRARSAARGGTPWASE